MWPWPLTYKINRVHPLTMANMSAKFDKATQSGEDGVAQSVEHWTANLATRVQSPSGEEPSDLICAFLHIQMESNWAGLSVCNCRHTGKWCGTIKAVGNTDHTRQTWIHMQTPLSPLAGCGPGGEGTSGKVLNWTVRSLNHAYTTTNTQRFSLYRVHNFITIHVYCDLDPQPLTSKINGIHPLTMASMSAKFDEEANNALVSIIFTSLFP